MFSKIERLKRKARFHYIRYTEQRNGLDCGNSMAEIFRPSIYKDKIEFNRIMDELAKIDPNTPPARL